MKIRIIVTGGTFDKEYNEVTGELFFNRTHIHEILRLGRCSVEVESETLMMIDSLDMSDGQRELIAQKCVDAEETGIVVTHGTDTMVETAKVIAAKRADKTVILTGAMIPYQFGSSDGLFNIGSALAFAQSLRPGVYLAMNGRYFPWDHARKNREKAAFEEL